MKIINYVDNQAKKFCFRSRDELNSLINALRGETSASTSVENGEIKTEENGEIKKEEKEEETAEPNVPKDVELEVKTDGVISVSIKDKISPKAEIPPNSPKNEPNANENKKQFGHSKKGIFLDTFEESIPVVTFTPEEKRKILHRHDPELTVSISPPPSARGRGRAASQKKTGKGRKPAAAEKGRGKLKSDEKEMLAPFIERRVLPK